MPKSGATRWAQNAAAPPLRQPARPVTNSDRLPNQLEVSVGTFVVLLTTSDLDTVAIAEPGIADVAVVNSRSVLVNGKAPGVTSLVVVDRFRIRQYQVRVLAAPGTLPRDIASQIGLTGVGVRQVRDAIILEGEVDSAEEMRRAVEIAGIYSTKVVNQLMVRGAPSSAAALETQIQRAIDLPNVTVQLIGDTALLRGAVDRSVQRQQAETVASAFAKRVVNLIDLPLLTPDQVQESLGVQSSSRMGADGTAISSVNFDQSSIRVRQVGDQIILEGVATSQAQLDQALAVAARTGLAVINRLQLAPAEATALNAITAAIGIPGVSVSGSPKRLVLRGTVPDSNTAMAAVQIARAFAVEVDNLLLTPDPILVNIDVAIVEINKADARNLGIQLGSVAVTSETRTPTSVTRVIDPTFLPGQILGGNGFAGFGPSGLISPIRVRLDALYSVNAARLLSNPRTTVLSGRTATFQVGGQVPIPAGSTTNGSGTSTTIIFKDFGILAEVTPVATREGYVTLRMRTEVSQPDFTLGVTPPGGGGPIPGFTRRSTVTEVTTRSEGTVALSGLIQNNVTKIISRTPILSRIPILGALFTSKRFQNNETELVIFMTPRVLDNTMPSGATAPAGVVASDNTTNVGTVLGNPGIPVFNSGGAFATAGGGAPSGGAGAMGGG
jgi:Flp pilus assembly secretin CpaC